MPAKPNVERQRRKLLQRLINGIERALKKPNLPPDITELLGRRLEYLKAPQFYADIPKFTIYFLTDQLEQLGPLLGICTDGFNAAVADAALDANAGPPGTMAERVGEMVRAALNATPSRYSHDKLVGRRDAFRETVNDRRYWSGAAQRGEAAATAEIVQSAWPAAEQRVRKRRGGKASQKEIVAEVAITHSLSTATVKRYAPKASDRKSTQKGS